MGKSEAPSPAAVSRDLSPKRGEVWAGRLRELEKLPNKYLAPFRGEVAANGRG
jgi:hypothetical protein